MLSGGTYMETVDQAKLSARFDMEQAYCRCRSFRRLVKIFGKLVRDMGIELCAWPPQKWQERPQQPDTKNKRWRPVRTA
ncbi:MAG TPA: hypothetical protein ENN80_01540 [Candidatus Hydrogenedentes bacterium]|nr:hypothetical protein [Candidatus Hydrogenedentota bacterium]